MPGPLGIGGGGSGGTVTTPVFPFIDRAVARTSDTASITYGTPVAVDGQATALDAGSGTDVARANHVHTLTNGVVYLGKATLASAAATLTLSGIPQGYAHLLLDVTLPTSPYVGLSQQVHLRFNGDAGANYRGNGTTLYYNNAAILFAGGTSAAGPGGWSRIPILWYSNASKYTYAAYSLGCQGISYPYGTTTTAGGYWANMAPVTAISVTGASGNLGVGTELAIYGMGVP